MWLLTIFIINNLKEAIGVLIFKAVYVIKRFYSIIKLQLLLFAFENYTSLFDLSFLNFADKFERRNL